MPRLTRSSLALLLASTTIFTTTAPGAFSRSSPRPVQINLSGYETAGARLGKDYVLPSDGTLRYFARKGFTTIRLPANWSRLQPVAGEPLSEPKLRELSAFLDRADHLNFRVIIDLHDYGRKDGHPLGSPELATGALAGFWGPFAARFRGRFAGYDLMNEPHDMPSPKAWPEAAQAAVDAIRKYDRVTPIYLEGDDWSSALRWPTSNAGLAVRDPANRLIYSAHIYFDHDTSGLYKLPFDRDGAAPDTGAARLRPFIGWLREHHLHGHVGEYGVPNNDRRWLPVLDRFLDEVAASGDVLTGSSYWAGGEWLDRYLLTVQPVRNGRWRDRPQMAVLRKPRRSPAP